VGYRESAGPRQSRYRRGSKHPRCLSSRSPPAMSRIARNPARLGKRAEHMIELVSSARRLGREIAPVVGVDRANAGAPARRHRCRRERVRQACSGCWSSSSLVEIVSKILQRGAHAPVIAEGRAYPPCRPDRRSDVGRANFGRTAPPIYPSVSFRQGQRGTRRRSPWFCSECSSR
jgi:hypothetical protein